MSEAAGSVVAFIRRFWLSAVSVAGLVGLYLGAEAVDKVRVFWFTVAVAAVVAAIPTGKPLLDKAFDLRAKVRSYPGLVARVATLEAELERAKKMSEALEDQTRNRYQDGILEGRKQFLGIFFSGQVKTVPKIIAISLRDAGLILVAKSSNGATLTRGTRFNVEVEATGEVKGAVEAIQVENDVAYLACVHQTVLEFWAKLEERAPADPSPPLGIRLTRYRPPG